MSIGFLLLYYIRIGFSTCGHKHAVLLDGKCTDMQTLHLKDTLYLLQLPSYTVGKYNTGVTKMLNNLS